MKRQIILDTETTGLLTTNGHRLIEIGCLEMINRRFTGRNFHRYLNPCRPVDKGAFAKVFNVPLKRFTLVGATTRAGLLSAPLRDRFGLFFHLDFYPPDDLAEIICRSAKLLTVKIDDSSAINIARRSRGTPRIANRLLRRVRDFASVKSDGEITPGLSDSAMEQQGIDELGLDKLDRRLLEVTIDYYKGGPVGVEALAATLSEEVDTLVDMVEPYLLKIGFLQRTRRGRMVGRDAYTHLGRKFTGPVLVEDVQETLF